MRDGVLDAIKQNEDEIRGLKENHHNPTDFRQWVVHEIMQLEKIV